eukprot:1686576-Rhodomonas_salina.1
MKPKTDWTAAGQLTSPRSKPIISSVSLERACDMHTSKTGDVTATEATAMLQPLNGTLFTHTRATALLHRAPSKDAERGSDRVGVKQRVVSLLPLRSNRKGRNRLLPRWSRRLCRLPRD